MPDAYRPTLYDFLAHEALEFYTSGEQAAARAQDEFELTADGPIFDPTDRFIAWNPVPAGPASETVTSPVLRAIRIYQDLLRFHQNDPARHLALANVDLERLAWGWNAAFGETKNDRYKKALQA